MYQQKTVMAKSTEELDKEVNKLFKEGYLFVSPPDFKISPNSSVVYVQMLLKPVE